MNTAAEATEAQALQPEQAPEFSNPKKAQALDLLGKNIPPGAVAAMLGVTPALISQYMQDSAFAQAVDSQRDITNLALVERDTKLEALESKALDKLGVVLEVAYKPRDVLDIYRTLNSAKRATTSDRNNTDASTKTVVLELPKHIENSLVQLNVEFNTSREVVSVQSKEMRTLPMADVLERVQQEQAKAQEPAHLSAEDLKNETPESLKIKSLF